jgi:hypothetical protein
MKHFQPHRFPFWAAPLLALALISCQNVTELDDPNELVLYNLSWKEVFERFWNGMNNNYVFWEQDTTDWDAVYETWRPKFAHLGEPLADTVFSYFNQMTSSLIDGHYKLTVQYLGKEIILRPAHNRMFARYGLDYFKYLLLEAGEGPEAAKAYAATSTDYMRSDFLVEKYCNAAVENRAGESFEKLVFEAWTAQSGYTLCSGTIDGIAYFGFSSFELTSIVNTYNDVEASGIYDAIDAFEDEHGLSDKQMLQDKESLALGPEWRIALELRRGIAILQAFVDQIHDANTKGVIVDLRGNTGGNDNDLSLLWGHMISSPHVPVESRIKSGDNRLDFSSWMPMYIYPARDAQDFQFPIVALVNGFSVSCAEISAMFVASLPHGIVVGDTTYGAHGPLTDNKIFNGGTFASPLVVEARTASSISRYIGDKKVYEGKGFPPTVPVEFDYDAYMSGTDTRLEAAIGRIIP